MIHQSWKVTDSRRKRVNQTNLTSINVLLISSTWYWVLEKLSSLFNKDDFVKLQSLVICFVTSWYWLDTSKNQEVVDNCFVTTWDSSIVWIIVSTRESNPGPTSHSQYYYYFYVYNRWLVESTVQLNSVLKLKLQLTITFFSSINDSLCLNNIILQCISQFTCMCIDVFQYW